MVEYLPYLKSGKLIQYRVKCFFCDSQFFLFNVEFTEVFIAYKRVIKEERNFTDINVEFTGVFIAWNVNVKHKRFKKRNRNFWIFGLDL